MRFSVFSLVVLIAVAACLIRLNMRERETVTEPSYAPMLGAARHPPPYTIQEMAIAVHRDRGWPFWHARSSDYFAAHNAALYLTEGGLSYDKAIPQTNALRLTMNIGVGIAILMLSLVACKTALRRSRRTVPNEHRE